MQHPTLHASARAFLWRAFGVLLVGCVSITSAAISAGMYRWVDAQGRVHLTDTPPPAQDTLHDLKIYQPGAPGQAPDPGHVLITEPGGARITPTKPGGTVLIDAVLNRRLTVPLLLDTGADFTVLTKKTATDIRLSPLERLPTQEFHTAGGTIKLPIATLPSIRVGSAEARDVEVAIDIDGHMSTGLLGMTFLRHFKVTVDHRRGQVTFER